jgi:hypothetical protein
MTCNGTGTSRNCTDPEDCLWCITQCKEVFRRFMTRMENIREQIRNDVDGSLIRNKRKGVWSWIVGLSTYSAYPRDNEGIHYSVID